MPFDKDLDDVLDEVAEAARPHASEGEVADYIPSMADLDPDSFGMAVVEMDGTEHATGDADTRFAIQSISKVFALVVAMAEADAADGVEAEMWERVGVEPSGDPFNSMVQLEHDEGIPRNPMINPGALVVDDILLDHCDDPAATMRSLLCELAGSDIEIDETVSRQEEGTGHRNRAMAHLMTAFDNINHDIDAVLDVYAHQCAMSMTARQLARAVRFLGNDGVDPATGRQVVSQELAHRVAAIMLTCGPYDSAGEFAFSIGFPCKSGVAGAIVGVVPDELGVCVWSPPLDDTGNSVAGRVALQELAGRLGLSLF